jgi:hypothetical protein
VVATDGTVPADGISVSLATPGQPVPATAVTAGGGLIGGIADPWAPLGAGPVLGAYTIAVPVAGNPTLDRAALTNIALILSYTFTPRS